MSGEMRVQRCKCGSWAIVAEGPAGLTICHFEVTSVEVIQKNGERLYRDAHNIVLDEYQTTKLFEAPK